MSDEDIDEKFKKLLMKKGMVSNELYCIHQSNIDVKDPLDIIGQR